MTQHSTFVLGCIWTVMLQGAAVLAGPINPARHPHSEQARSVHVVEHDVDDAWEVYHRAALGGTVASPALQTDIEQHLHEARTLVTRAQEAADRGEKRQVDRLVAEIKIHTSQAIKGSKEQKK
jgi:uncharacterized protein YqgV (UPF0045/DUF77 family)